MKLLEIKRYKFNFENGLILRIDFCRGEEGGGVDNKWSNRLHFVVLFFNFGLRKREG